MPKLRVGLLLDDYVLASWAAELVEMIQRSTHSEVCLLVMPEETPPRPPKSTLRRITDNIDQLFPLAARKMMERYYERILERRTYGRPSDTPRDTREFLGHVPVVRVTPRRTRWSDAIPEEQLTAIRGYDLDVLIRLGFRILRGGILQAARAGVWSYHHGDNAVNRGGPPGFWEVMEDWPTTGSILQILTEDLDNGLVLSRTQSATNWASVRDNRNNYYWKTISLIPRKLAQLQRQGHAAFLEQVKAENAAPMLYSRRLYTAPDNWGYARALVRRTARKAREVLKNLRYLDQWILLYDLRPTLSTSLWRYQRIVPPPDRFWADPFVVQRDGAYYIFIEELLYATNRGHISVIRLDGKGRYEAPVPVLERPYHLSYPFVFEHEGELYLVPESAENNTIELYRCTRFPDQWSFVHNLMEGVKAYDATLHQQDGRWWLFANLVEVPGASSCDELFAFHADSPLSRSWTPHLQNPIVSDCRSARPAGRIFSLNGDWYRPSQNCADHYGYGFNLARIETLTPEAYREEIVTRVLPDWSPDLVSTHTFNRAGDLHVIDAQWRRRR